MNSDLSVFVATLPTQMVIFMVMLCRSVAMIVMLPAFGSQSLPKTVRASMAVLLTLLLFPQLHDRFAGARPDDILEPGKVMMMIFSEVLVGSLIGWLAQLMALSLPIAAQILSTFIGLSNVLQPDPELGAQSTPVSHLAEMVVPVLFCSTHLYVMPLSAFVGSYEVFPAGHFPFLGDAAHTVVQTTSKSFLLAFQLATPFVLIGTIWPAMLGLLSRFSPGLQVYNLAMPAQLLAGIFLLALLIGDMLPTWSQAMTVAFAGLPRAP